MPIIMLIYDLYLTSREGCHDIGEVPNARISLWVIVGRGRQVFVKVDPNKQCVVEYSYIAGLANLHSPYEEVPQQIVEAD